MCVHLCSSVIYDTHLHASVIAIAIAIAIDIAVVLRVVVVVVVEIVVPFIRHVAVESFMFAAVIICC